MYNRYIPQHDGSFQRRAVPDSRQPNGPLPPPPPAEPPAPPKLPQPPPRPAPSPAVGGFLRNLLPREFDTGDLIIVLLLLLMAGDCEEERNNALLTLALYFLM